MSLVNPPGGSYFIDGPMFFFGDVNRDKQFGGLADWFLLRVDCVTKHISKRGIFRKSYEGSALNFGVKFRVYSDVGHKKPP